MKTTNTLCGLIVSVLFTCLAAQSNAQVTIHPPGLNPGDSYRLIFVTSEKTTATNGTFFPYDAFANSAAASSTQLVSLDTTWKALVSVPTNQTPHAARDHTGTSPTTSIPSNVPIYNLQGQLVASTYADLWDGSIANAIRYDQFGNSVSTPVWTGTAANGFGIASRQVGHSIVQIGDPQVTIRTWIGFNGGATRPNSELHSIYAVSGTLTAPESMNEPPTANAGPDQSIRSGDTVSLDGTASFDDNTASNALQYSWQFLSYPGTSAPTLTDANTASPSFVADEVGTYVVELVVTDEENSISTPDQVEISSENLAPTAVALVDFELAVVGTTSYFDGSGSSDPELDEITFSWEITAAPLGSSATLVDADTAIPSLTTDMEGTYEVTLTVSDSLGPGAPASVEFVATTPQNYAEMKIMEASDLIQSLSLAQLTSKGNQTALGKFLKNATKDLQRGNTSQAIDDLNKALERTDGCALRGSPDGNGSGRDWVIDCDAQHGIYNALKLAIDLLQLPQ